MALGPYKAAVNRRPARRSLRPDELRTRIAHYVRVRAEEREDCGDPEGAGIMLDMARDIARFRLTEDC